MNSKDKPGFISELVPGLIALFDLITPYRIILALIFLQPLLEFTKSPELNVIRHISQRLAIAWLLLFFIWQFFQGKNIKLNRYGFEIPLFIYFASTFFSVLVASQTVGIDYTKAATSLLTLPVLIATSYLIPFYMDKNNSHIVVFKAVFYSLAFTSVVGIIQFLVFSLMYPMGFRISSVFHDPNIFSRFILIGFSFTFAHLFVSKKPVIKKPVLIFVLILALLCLLFSFSRSGYATLFLILAAFILIQGTRKQRLIIIPLIIAIGIAAFLFLFSQRAFDGNEFLDESSVNRLQLLFAGIDIIKNHWLFGVGYANFPFIYAENYVVGVFGMSLFEYEMLGGAFAIHNWLVEVWAEQGIIGVAAYIFFFYKLVKIIRREIKLSADDTTKSFLVGSYLVILVFLLHGFFYHTFISQFFFWTMLGAVVLFIDVSKKQFKETEN